MQIEVTQFIRPNGRQVVVSGEISDLCKKNYEVLCSLGCRITMELIEIFDKVSVCIEHPDIGDFSQKMVNNDPNVRFVVEEMIMDFDEVSFQKWAKETLGEDEFLVREMENELEDNIFNDDIENEHNN